VTLSGSCLDKAAYSTNDDIMIYVSNTATDYAKATTTHLGTSADPDISLMRAIDRAKDMAAPYTTKLDGSELVINIVLYKGDHYMLREAFDRSLSYSDAYSASYHLKITPLYCTLMGTPDTSICYDLDAGTDALNVYNKLGPMFTINVPQKLTIEYIVFEMIDSFIPFEDDPDSCLTTRKKCCAFDNTAAKDATVAILQIDAAQTETCILRIRVADYCHRAPKYNMFNFHPYATAYGMTSPPELIFTSVTINDVFYEMNSLIDFNIGGYVTITNSNFQRISNCGGIIKNENPTIINYLPAVVSYTQYLNHFNLRKNTIVSDHDCVATD
jgi:hypothetical protein